MNRQVLRHRIARWVLGYTPVHVPEAEGAYVVIRTGKPEDRYRATAIITAETFTLDMSTPVRSLAYEDEPEYRPTGTTGTFSGTINTVPDGPREYRGDGRVLPRDADISAAGGGHRDASLRAT